MDYRTRNILEQAIRHNGYALVDIFQLRVSFNKLNTFQWFEENTGIFKDNHTTLYEREPDTKRLYALIYKYRIAG